MLSCAGGEILKPKSPIPLSMCVVQKQTNANTNTDLSVILETNLKTQGAMSCCMILLKAAITRLANF